MKHMWSEEEIQALIESQGGGKLYQHYITVQQGSNMIYLTLYTSIQTAFTTSTLIKFIGNKKLVVGGYFYLDGVGYGATVISSNNVDEFTVFQNMYDGKTLTFSTNIRITDIVTEV